MFGTTQLKFLKTLFFFFFSLQATTPNNTTTSGDLIHSRGFCYREIEMSIDPPVGTGDAQVSSPSETSSTSKALSSSSSWLNLSPTCTAILCSWQLPRSEVLAKSSICLSNFFTFCSASEICYIRWPSSCSNAAPVFQCFNLWHSNTCASQSHTHPSFWIQKNFAISSQSIHAFPQIFNLAIFVLDVVPTQQDHSVVKSQEPQALVSQCHACWKGLQGH
ncbi:hypothetical protein L873DRAFT_1061650 [Choiromyces venosus 120613-1]|uniref:Uncharacterized protein n=1 Tax=Choiromyces venosus 120613-1 TaxID=1336337 RepID=A0A3N4JIW3_9PEZI|nr:hypothetical protein L873DRAFT_1061650 [Choiromyces venosus 120613-1]